jgi:hypothetical protein
MESKTIKNYYHPVEIKARKNKKSALMTDPPVCLPYPSKSESQKYL